LFTPISLEHNYGLGKKHLSAVFVTIMMLAFLKEKNVFKHKKSFL